MKRLLKHSKSRQTAHVFEKKWKEYPNLTFSETSNTSSEFHKWILERNGFLSEIEFSEWVKYRHRILDAGCGNGRILNLFRKYVPLETKLVGVDLNIDAAKNNFSNFPNVQIFRQDLTKNMAKLGKFDLIYCQEVLQHTKNPEKAFGNLVDLLSNGGEIAIYVYKKKFVAREFMDEYVRDVCNRLNSEDKKELVKQITYFAKCLSEIPETFEFPPIPMLNLQEDYSTIHRYIYNHFFKCFWNPNLNFEDNAAINEDWYFPQLASKFTVQQVREWFVSNNLSVIHENVDYSGITIRGRKNT